MFDIRAQYLLEKALEGGMLQRNFCSLNGGTQNFQERKECEFEPVEVDYPCFFC